MGRHRSGCGCWRWRWPASGRWWPLGLPGSMTPIWSRLRMPELLDAPVGSGAVLAVRLEMAAVYLRLVRG